MNSDPDVTYVVPGPEALGPQAARALWLPRGAHSTHPAPTQQQQELAPSTQHPPSSSFSLVRLSLLPPSTQHPPSSSRSLAPTPTQQQLQLGAVSPSTPSSSRSLVRLSQHPPTQQQLQLAPTQQQQELGASLPAPSTQHPPSSSWSSVRLSQHPAPAAACSASLPAPTQQQQELAPTQQQQELGASLPAPTQQQQELGASLPAPTQQQQELSHPQQVVSTHPAAAGAWCASPSTHPAAASVRLSQHPPSSSRSLVRLSQHPPSSSRSSVRLSQHPPSSSRSSVRLSQHPPSSSRSSVRLSQHPPSSSRSSVRLSQHPPSSSRSSVRLSQHPPSSSFSSVRLSQHPPSSSFSSVRLSQHPPRGGREPPRTPLPPLLLSAHASLEESRHGADFSRGGGGGGVGGSAAAGKVGLFYRGAIDVTESGARCLNWGQVAGYGTERYRDRGVGDHNHCRNPDGRIRPWCFFNNTARGRVDWGYCDCKHGSVRLQGGRSKLEGQVEVYLGGVWGPICSQGWSDRDASVVCRQLGKGVLTGHARTTPLSPLGVARLHWGAVHCQGAEPALLQCPRTAWNGGECPLAAAVTCSAQQAMVPVRLVGGVSGSEGRVEVFHGGQWGSVCDDQWDDSDAEVVCRQLGLSGVARAWGQARYGEGSGRVWLDDVRCTGNELSLEQCAKAAWGDHDCVHSEDAGVSCHTLADGTARLAGGAERHEGRVEVFYQGQWGTVCDDGWTDANTMVGLGGHPAPRFGWGSGPVLLDDVSCTGREAGLALCPRRDWSLHDCTHYEDVSVSCRLQSRRGHSARPASLPVQLTSSSRTGPEPQPNRGAGDTRGGFMGSRSARPCLEVLFPDRSG
ncbi:hypothetical protein CRUP_016922 [Coryphaenoides rupestris]|nr:hypothetical protein CRUP_016922 [Coryphaenoides rupestris]